MAKRRRRRTIGKGGGLVATWSLRTVFLQRRAGARGEFLRRELSCEEQGDADVETMMSCYRRLHTAHLCNDGLRQRQIFSFPVRSYHRAGVNLAHDSSRSSYERSKPQGDSFDGRRAPDFRFRELVRGVVCRVSGSEGFLDGPILATCCICTFKGSKA